MVCDGGGGGKGEGEMLYTEYDVRWPDVVSMKPRLGRYIISVLLLVRAGSTIVQDGHSWRWAALLCASPNQGLGDGRVVRVVGSC